MKTLIMTKKESNSLLETLTNLMEASRKAGCDKRLSKDDMSDEEFRAMAAVVSTVNAMLADNADEMLSEEANRVKLWDALGIRHSA